MGSSRNTIAILVLAGGMLVGGPVVLAQGDGSRTDNPDLLRGSLGVGCSPGTLCHFPRADLVDPIDLPHHPVLPAPSAPAPAPAPPEPAPPALIDPLPVHSVPSVPVPVPVPGATPDFGYGITLRGAYVRSNGDDRFEILAIPEVSFSRSGAATDAGLAASATIVRPQSDDFRLASGNLSAGIVHRLSPSAGLAFNADLALAQDDPAGLSVRDTEVQTAPFEAAGGLSAAYNQTFGQLSTTGTLGFTRDWRGPATLADGSETDNAGENLTRYESALRVGYAITPVVELFGSGRVGRSVFDAADPDLGVSRTSTDFALRGGLAADLYDVLTLEASIGSGWRAYDDFGLADAQSVLYGAAIGFRPTATTQLTASLDTELTPGDGGAGATTSYRAGLEAAHLANSWLALRARAGLEWLAPQDGTPASQLYSAGLGADFVLGPHTSAALDYQYGLREDPGAAVTRRDEHRVSGGLSLRY